MPSDAKLLHREKSRALSTNYLVKVAVLAAIARVVMFLEFPLPIFPTFLKLDFSDLIPLLGGLAMGPLAGVLIELMKNLLHLLNSTTGGVGDIANFAVGAAYVFFVSYFYKRHKSKKGALTGLVAGIFAMVLAAGLVNYFITVPLYAIVLGLSTDAIVGMSAAVIPAIHDKLTLILFAFCPFTFLKGILLTLIALPLYKHVSPLLHKGL